MEPLADVLLEYPITFPPSYPYEEEPALPQHYMTTRCPAWCDRILMSQDARDLIRPTGGGTGVGESTAEVDCGDYNVIGDAVCMGDHKVHATVYNMFCVTYCITIPCPLLAARLPQHPLGHAQRYHSLLYLFRSTTTTTTPAICHTPA